MPALAIQDHAESTHAARCRINGLTHLNLTKLDVLSDLEMIQLGVGYRLHGKRIQSMPSVIEDLEAVSVDCGFMPGWLCDISKVHYLRWHAAICWWEPPGSTRYLAHLWSVWALCARQVETQCMLARPADSLARR